MVEHPQPLRGSGALPFPDASFENGRQALASDITALLGRCNTAGAASLVVPSEYLEAAITKRSV
jgi:hypothetical protein